MRIKNLKTAFVVLILGALALKAIGRVISAVADKPFKAPRGYAARLSLSHSLIAHGARTPCNASADGAKF